MAFEKIQLGLDIATALSVIGASGAFILNLREAEKLKRENKRLEQTTKVVDDLLKFLNKGIDLQVQSKRLIDKKSTNPEIDIAEQSSKIIDDVYYFCYEVDLYLRFHTEVLLTSVATESQNNTIEELRTGLKEFAGKVNIGGVKILEILEFINENLTKFMDPLKAK